MIALCLSAHFAACALIGPRFAWLMKNPAEVDQGVKVMRVLSIACLGVGVVMMMEN